MKKGKAVIAEPGPGCAHSGPPQDNLFAQAHIYNAIAYRPGPHPKRSPSGYRLVVAL